MRNSCKSLTSAICIGLVFISRLLAQNEFEETSSSELSSVTTMTASDLTIDLNSVILNADGNEETEPNEDQHGNNAPNIPSEPYDPVDPEEPEEPEDFVGVLIEVIDDLVVIDSKDEGRVIRFYVINDENGAPDREVLAMLKEIAIGTEVLVVAEGETLVHIEAHDTEDPVDPEEPEEPEDFVGILVEVIDDLVVIDSKDEGRVIRFYVINDENGAPDREVLAMLKEIAIGTEVLVVAEGETLVHIEAHDTEDPVDPEEPDEPEDFVGILIEVIDDLVVIDSKEQGRVIRFYVINDENGAPDREVLAMLKEIAIGTEVLVVAEGETLIHIEAHDTEDPVDPKEHEEPEDFVGILVEVMDDLFVIDSKEQGRAIRFYILKDEAGAPDRDVLAMLKEIAIGTEVLVVAEGETLVHIEAHDTEDPVDPEEPEEPEDFVGILVEVIDDLVVIDSKEQGRAIRFYILKDEAGAPDREVLAMLKEIAIGTEVLVVAEGETLVHIEAHDTEDPVDPEEPEEPEDFVGILVEVIDDLVVIDSKEQDVRLDSTSLRTKLVLLTVRFSLCSRKSQSVLRFSLLPKVRHSFTSRHTTPRIRLTLKTLKNQKTLSVSLSR